MRASIGRDQDAEGADSHFRLLNWADGSVDDSVALRRAVAQLVLETTAEGIWLVDAQVRTIFGELGRRNRALVFDLLLKSIAGALLTLGRDPKLFGPSAQLGVTTGLHTRARDRHFHPHAHWIVTGGGLAFDGKTWVGAAPDSLLPVHVLGALFRVNSSTASNDWAPGAFSPTSSTTEPRAAAAPGFTTTNGSLRQAPVGWRGADLRHLGRSTHRVAISNARLVSTDDQAVVFSHPRPVATVVAMSPWATARARR